MCRRAAGVQRYKAAYLMPDKRAELFYLRRLPELGIPLPEGELHASESPDFLISSPTSRIGIEVVELFHSHETSDGSSRQAQEAMWEQVLLLAREINDRSGGRPVYVAVFLRRGIQLVKHRVQPLAHELAEIVGEARVQPGERRTYEAGVPACPALPVEIDTVDISHIGGEGSPRWSAPDPVCVPTLDTSEVQMWIDKKNPRALLYRNHCDSVWLLLAIGGYPMSRHFVLAPGLDAKVYESQFDKTLLLHHFEDRVIELNTEPCRTRIICP